jgi:hypothetical protein
VPHEGLLNGAFMSAGYLCCLCPYSTVLVFLVLGRPYLAQVACQPEHTVKMNNDAAINPSPTLPPTPFTYVGAQPRKERTSILCSAQICENTAKVNFITPRACGYYPSIQSFLNDGQDQKKGMPDLHAADANGL